MLQAILDKGLHMLVHIKDEDGQSPIEFASKVGFEEGEVILLNELNKDPKNTGDVCVNQHVLELTPDAFCDLREEEHVAEGVILSPDWDARHERMRKLLGNVMLPQLQQQGMALRFMDLGLYEATKKGDVDELISALEKYSSEQNLSLPTIFSQLTPLHNTFLHIASRYGHKDLSWLIFQYFPDLLHRVNIHGNTALHLAVTHRHFDTVKILVKVINKSLRKEIQLKIDLDLNTETYMMEGMAMLMENDDGRTPLQLAQMSGCQKVIEFLIKENVEVAYHVNKTGTSPLYIAILNGKATQMNNIFNTVSHYVEQNVLDDQLTKGKSLLLAAIWSLEIEILQELAREKPLLLNVKDEHAQKLVHFAESLGFHEGANYLRNEFKLEIVLDSTETSGENSRLPIHSYSLDEHSLSFVEIVEQKIEKIGQLMHRNGRDERMRKLMFNSSLRYTSQGNQNKNYMDVKLYEAAMKGDVDSFIGALEKFSQANNDQSLLTISEQSTHIGNTFLHVAASCGNEDLTGFILYYFRYLLRDTNRKGNTPIHEAARAGHLGVLDILVKVTKYHEQLFSFKESDIVDSESKDTWWLYNSAGNNSLLEAFANNQINVIEYLIKSSVEEAYYVTDEGKSGLYLAVEEGMVDAVKTILSKITSDDTVKNWYELINGKSLINAAIRRRSTVMLQELSRKIPSQIHVTDEDGQTPLFYAVSTGFLEGVNFLLDQLKMDTSQKDSVGFYPVHVASKSAHIPILEKLMQTLPDSGGFLNGKDQNILHVAAKNGKDNVVKFILQTKNLEFLINEMDKDGNTPLHLATINWHPKVVSSLTWDQRVNLNLVNKDGLTALDAVEECMETLTSFQQRLTWTALMSAGAPRARNQHKLSFKKLNLSRKDISVKNERSNMDHSKDRVNTLLLVATLVATVTFAAGFTMPGGYKNSEPNEGQATLLRKFMFQSFVICDTIALYSSIMVAVTLIWAQLGDLTLVVNALRFALPLLAISLTTMSVAFMAGVSLVVGSLTWLACFVLTFGTFSLAIVLTLFTPLCFPGSSTSPVLRYITYYIFNLLVIASGSSDDRHIKPQ